MKKSLRIFIDEELLSMLVNISLENQEDIGSVISRFIYTPKTLADLLEKSNPYPDDIFTPMLSEDWVKTTRVLHEAGITPDRVFGNWGRRVWQNCVEFIKKDSQDLPSTQKQPEEEANPKNSDENTENSDEDIPVSDETATENQELPQEKIEEEKNQN